MSKKRLDGIKACEKKIEELQKEVKKLRDLETGDGKKGLESVKKAVKANASHMAGLGNNCSGIDCSEAYCGSVECFAVQLENELSKL